MLAALTGYVAAPLYRRAPAARTGPDPALAARRDALVEALRELELERVTGLVADDDYHTQRAALEADAAALMRLAGD